VDFVFKIFICEVPALKDRFVDVKFTGFPPVVDEPRFMVELLRLIALIDALLELSDSVVIANPPELNVPLFTAIELVNPVVSADPNVHAPPTPLKVSEPLRVVPLVVTVLPVVVALNVIAPVELHTVPANKDIDPLIVGVPVLLNVTVPAETVKSRQVSAPVNVTV
jgi:hypothetical protein